MYGQESSMQMKQVGEGAVQSPKKGLNIGLLIGIAILLLTLISVSFFLILKNTGGDKGSTRSSISASATNGVTPTPTNTPTPTMTPTQALFSDNFANNSDGWDTSSDAGYIRDVSNNMLTLADTKHGTILTESLPTNNTFDDFTITVTFTLVQADQNDSAGIYVRGDSNLDHDYRIEINGDNTFDIMKEYLDTKTNPQSSILMAPTKVASLHSVGRSNTLKVTLKGAKILVIINNEMVSSVTDSDYTRGQITLFAHNGNTSHGVKATFSNVEVDRLPN